MIEIIEAMDNKYGKIWGSKRPYISKDLFVNKMRENDNVHILETSQIKKIIFQINRDIRNKPRKDRLKKCSKNLHNRCEKMNFFLSYDKELNWIDEI